MSAVVAQQKSHVGTAVFALVEAGVGGLATVITVALGLNAVAAAVIIAGAAIIPPLVLVFLAARRRKGIVEIGALGRGEIQRPIVAIVFIAGLGLVLIESLLFGSIGLVIELTAESIAGAQYGYAWSSLVVGYPWFIVLAFLFAVRISHYILHKPWLWWGISIVIYVVVRGALILTQLQNPLFEGLDVASAYVELALKGALLFGLALIAWAWSRRYHLEFVAARLLRALSAGDKSAALELLREASSVTPPAERVESQAPVTRGS